MILNSITTNLEDLATFIRNFIRGVLQGVTLKIRELENLISAILIICISQFDCGLKIKIF